MTDHRKVLESTPEPATLDRTMPAPSTPAEKGANIGGITKTAESGLRNDQAASGETPQPAPDVESHAERRYRISTCAHGEPGRPRRAVDDEAARADANPPENESALESLGRADRGPARRRSGRQGASPLDLPPDEVDSWESPWPAEYSPQSLPCGATTAGRRFSYARKPLLAGHGAQFASLRCQCQSSTTRVTPRKAPDVSPHLELSADARLAAAPRHGRRDPAFRSQPAVGSVAADGATRPVHPGFPEAATGGDADPPAQPGRRAANDLSLIRGGEVGRADRFIAADGTRCPIASGPKVGHFRRDRGSCDDLD